MVASGVVRRQIARAQNALCRAIKGRSRGALQALRGSFSVAPRDALELR
jgi:hypothetical protein